MATVRTFNTTKEVFDFLDESARLYKEAMKDHPIKVDDLRHGDYAVSDRREDCGAVIFIEVLERTSYPEDTDSITQARQSGWIAGQCYSEMCKDGEFGDTHVTRICGKVTKEVFDRAKANGFRHLNSTN